MARRAGVSTATVSRVLNCPEKVALSTADRVRAAMAALDYRPNLFASGLMTRSSRVLGLVLPDEFAGVTIEMLRGAEEEARRLGYHLLLTTASRLADAESVRATPALGMLDAVGLLVEHPSAALRACAESLGVPVVSPEDLRGKWNSTDTGVGVVRALAQRAAERA